jgi:RimJ/RimL family protein N-acetyltransferase
MIELLSVPYCIKSKVTIFNIFSTTSNKAIGFVSIRGINIAKSFAEIGSAIVDRKYRNREYGTEVLKRVIDYTSNELDLTLLGLTVFPSNERAITVYEEVNLYKKRFLKKFLITP